MMDNLFADKGVHVVVDGQFGSTGKGALCAWLAAEAIKQGVKFDAVVSNAGPNSGHTFYHNGEKHVLKQLPTFAVASHLMGVTVPVVLSSGAIINLDTLETELKKYPDIPVAISATAALISREDVDSEHSGTVAAVAGTRSGTGAALARKVLRDREAVIKHSDRVRDLVKNNDVTVSDMGGYPTPQSPFGSRTFVEVSQGFSLGINQRFYPKVTSRECTVSQALADAGLPPRSVSKTYMTLRTFPIRVGNVDGHDSGGWYYDQEEISWSDIGVAPELTTVTQRERRIATFSDFQLRLALLANDPDWVFVNFLNYLENDSTRSQFLTRIRGTIKNDRKEIGIIEGYGPSSDDIRTSSIDCHIST
jgi:adenylosuccinate synthase